MTSPRSLFTEHPASVGETWGEHWFTAMSFASSLFTAAVCCFVHAFLPFVFVKNASVRIAELYGRMVLHRSRLPASAVAATEWSDYTL